MSFRSRIKALMHQMDRESRQLDVALAGEIQRHQPKWGLTETWVESVLSRGLRIGDALAAGDPPLPSGLDVAFVQWYVDLFASVGHPLEVSHEPD